LLSKAVIAILSFFNLPAMDVEIYFSEQKLFVCAFFSVYPYSRPDGSEFFVSLIHSHYMILSIGGASLATQCCRY